MTGNRIVSTRAATEPSRFGQLWRRQRERWADPRELAHAIHGLVVGAAVMVAASLHGELGQVVVAVVFTLAVYWVAERYSHILAEGVRGERPTRAGVAASFRRGWPMVQVSYAPLLVLVGVTLVTGDLPPGVLAALGFSTVLLAVLGYAAARRSGVTGLAVWGWTAGTAVLGFAIMGLKLLLH